jgi:serine O-acetyltransferase
MLGQMDVVDNHTDHASLVSAEIADWSRETPRQFWDPGRKLLLSIRRYQYWHQRRGIIAGVIRKGLVLRHRFWSVVTGADIPLNCQIGGGLLIPHPNGIVIHPDAKIGVNCLIFQQVTIGSRQIQGLPEIGGHVDIGAGAKILGPVRIGTHAKIGANAVISKSVGSEAIAIGSDK